MSARVLLGWIKPEDLVQPAAADEAGVGHRRGGDERLNFHQQWPRALDAGEDDVAHAFAVRSLPAPGRIDQVVPVLVMHDRRVGRIRGVAHQGPVTR